MKPARWSSVSLRRRLLLWLLLPLVGLIALNAWWTYGRAVQVANEAHDRSLYLTTRTLAEELQWVNGVLRLDVLKGAGYLFENHTGARLLYRIDSQDGHFLAGNTDVPLLPAEREQSVKFFALVDFDDGLYRGEVVRLARLLHVVDSTSAPPPMVQITVMETREVRDQLIAQVLRETLVGQALVLLAAALTVVVGVQRGIRPLEAFRRRLAERSDDDFSPVHLPQPPKELRPLIDTVNAHLARLGRLIGIRKRFLDNAAHQLRTPLTILKTQAELLLRGAPGPEQTALIQAVHRTAGDAARLSEQLLALTQVEHAADMQRWEAVDLVALARSTTEARLLQAHERGDDLGFESQVLRCEVQGVPLLLGEALGNLIDNAMVHGGPGVHITVRVGLAWFEVEDNGPGIASVHQAHVFERFYRGASDPAVKGNGLGLAIVREIALQHQADWHLHSPVAQGRGTRIRVSWSTGVSRSVFG
ncbi:MAG: Sensor protein QseC [Pseudomonadota bacterium]|jgi:two-component system sensor histidine kinase TctE